MSLSQLLGTELPLLQAPMAGVQGARLAAAVSKAGALGALPCAMLSVERVREEVSAIRAQTAHPFNLNFFCHTPPSADAARAAAWQQRLATDYARMGVALDANAASTSRRPFDAQTLALVGELRPAVVSFHFGLPEAALWQPLRALGIRIIASATTLQEGRWLEQQGVDAVIAQGWEAGGHRGMFLSDELSTQMGLFALLPQLVAQLRVPVIAAGGIADAAGVAAAMRLGAAGVQIGTAYLLCTEADTSAVHRAALLSEQAQQTAVTNVFTGRPARGIVNHAMRAWGPINPEAPEFPLAAQFVAPLRKAAEAQGSGDYTPLWAGQNASGCREVSAAEQTWALAQGLGAQEPPCLV